MVKLIASSPTTKSLLLDLYYAGSISLLNMSLRGAWQCEAVLALRSSGKSLSTELWLRLRLRLGGRVGGSVPLATPDSVHSTFFELQLLLKLRIRLRLGRGGEDQFQ